MITQTQHIKANERTAILSLLKQMINVLETPAPSMPLPPSSYKRPFLKPSLKSAIRTDFKNHFKQKWGL